MNAFHELTNYTIDDIQKLIDIKATESSYLEFKASGALKKDPNLNFEIGKDVSAFANADGGTIVYGIKEKDGVAEEMTFIDSREFSKERLQQIIDSNIQRRVAGVSIYPIQNPKNFTEVIYVVKIPASPQAPHMSINKQFYRRNSTGNVVMDEYEVRLLYNRKERTELEICEIQGFSGFQNFLLGTTRISNFGFDLRFFVKNVSNSIEFNYKFEFQVPPNMVMVVPQNTARYKIRHVPYGVVYSISNSEPIFQDDTVPVADVMLHVSAGNYKAFKEGALRVKLYYSNGVIEKEYPFYDFFRFKDLQISEEFFK